LAFVMFHGFLIIFCLRYLSISQGCKDSHKKVAVNIEKSISQHLSLR